HEMSEEVRFGNGKSYNLGQLLEAYHDAIEERRHAETLFTYGYMSLSEKAHAERLYWTICTDINARVQAANPERVPAELGELDEHLVDQVLCDFSVFQSLTDHWSIHQCFPILPIHRLDEYPSRRCRLDDLTCDSFGTIEQFAAPGEPANFLNLHPLVPDEQYYLGVFLTGAYQDSLADYHNLFGTVAEAHVVEDETDPDGFSIRRVVPGSTVKSMLERARYRASDILQSIDAQIDGEVKSGTLQADEGSVLSDRFRSMLEESTYLETL
ncbi:MAG: biosynthetic arginine decarboxylase, partial [Rubricoccaceae bacterium]|nr:biosynthetic arginine decarboxylase [Rubricoccaceae bacterium]